MSTENNQIQEQNNPLSDFIPSSDKLIKIVTLITVVGLVVFPSLALTLDPSVAIHMWVMAVLDLGLLLSSIYFQKFLLPASTEQQEQIADTPLGDEDEDEDEQKTLKKSKKNKSNLKKKTKAE